MSRFLDEAMKERLENTRFEQRENQGVGKETQFKARESRSGMISCLHVYSFRVSRARFRNREWTKDGGDGFEDSEEVVRESLELRKVEGDGLCGIEKERSRVVLSLGRIGNSGVSDAEEVE